MTTGPSMTPGSAQSPLPAESGWPADPARRPLHSTLRLQPVVLAPPPDPDGVTAADDLDLRDLDDGKRVSRLAGVLAAVVVALTAAAAYFVLSAPTDHPAETPIARPASPPPATPASPPVAIVAPTAPPAAPALAPPAPSAAPPTAPAVDMADVGDELIPPSTEGLAPARRVQAVRIIVENDREVVPAR